MILDDDVAWWSDQSFLAGGGDMGALMRAHDWSKSPLGKPGSWPQPLKTLVGVTLASSQPMFVAWGARRTLLYNDAYAALINEQHPAGLGRPFFDVWPDIADQTVPLFERVFAGEPVQMGNIKFALMRDGRLQEAHFAFSYTPVRDEANAVAGLFGVCSETTHSVLAERRRYALLNLDDRLRDVADTADLSFAASQMLGETLGAARVGFGAFDPNATTIMIERDWQAPGFASLAGLHQLSDCGSHGEDLNRGQPVVNRNVETDPRTSPDPEALIAIGVRAFLHVPIVENGRMVAQMFVHSATPREWTNDEIAFVSGIAERTHAIIARRQAEAGLRANEARQRLRVELDDALHGLTSASEIMAAIAERLGPYLGVDQANYYLIAGERFVVSEEWRTERSRGLIGSHRIADFGPAARRLSELKAVLRLNDTQRAEGAKAYAAAGMAAVMSVPLHSGGLWGGGFHVHSAEPRVWTDEEAALVRETAERAWAEMERARAEAELRASEEFNRRVLASSADCIKVLDLEGRLEFMSGGGMGVMEVDDFGAIAVTYWPDLWPPDERTKVFAALEEARRGGKGRFQGFAKTMKGSPRWWDVAVTPINGPNGRPEKLLSVSRDITAAHRAEERLRELNATLEARVAERTTERNLLATIVETTNTQIQALDRDFRWIAINAANADAYERIYGKRPRVGDSLLELLANTPTEQAAAKALWSRALAGESFIEVSAWGDGAFDRRHYEMRFETLRDADGAPIGAFLTGSDITDRVREQQRLAEAEEALRQSQKMEAMGQLTGGVSHDFNNLLSPIIGGLDLLQRRGVGDERAQRTIAGALQSAERAKTLVQRLLAFARRQPLQPTAIDIGTLVAGMAELVESTTGPQVTVAVEVAEGLPPARADAHQVEMALLNLCVNAKDAGGDLTIAAAAESFDNAGNPYGLAAGDYIRLSVADTGIGMDEATLKRAVEPFFTSKGVGKGTGLGLSMVHGLAAQLGGTLEITSRVGVGTTVRLWLPVATEVTGLEATPIGVERPVSSGVVLLVDDEVLVRESSADMLSDLGYVVIEAESATAALKLLGDGLRPDVLVTDHLMPGMSGTDLARQVRAERLAPRVLVVSGYSEVGGIPTDIKRLTKPFRASDLAAAIDSLLPTFDLDAADS